MENYNPNNINFSELSSKEKSKLKSRIGDSVRAYQRMKRRKIYGFSLAAASIVVLFSIGIFNYNKQDSSPIESFVNTSQNQIQTNEVKLILSNSNSVEITEEDSEIMYSSTGENVIIGNSKSLNQNLEANKATVFNTLIVPYGKRSEIVLSDGSKVWLNSGSKLVFPASFAGDKREVYMEGEAIFEVAHNKNNPFIVKSKDQDIEVLGTVFNISNYTDDAFVFTVLKSGSINLHYKNNNLISTKSELKITPNTLATYSKDARKISVKTVEVEAYFSWREGVFIFKNDPLESIMKKLSRYYNIEITINDKELANHSFSGYLDVNQDIEHVMQIIKEAESSVFDYELTTNNKLIIN